ncbi:1-deoxy-D-xylulose-5-phosphate synthase [Qiania dongpingensis]|uniref:1-deoxy-D-xylulose-5-phosphate synthase n=1 Tax=Qiania dongpingensis TaxID=2763669 RepID=A0A7G9G7Z4_9FIRM|nr:1-deoxy-D-xylulose-5-phosphate synthase [Qiania dongpingensis]QNM06926.1 1-deoxy-D-xylulose-5-phosphate synthase [Qiania dongpingensis]
MMLEEIRSPEDLKALDPAQFPALAEEIRQFLIEKVSEHGGHLASNLGVVELTMALHLALNLPEDKIVWDVGHQSYTHKLLSGRREDFESLREYGGMSGFPKRRESEFDSFDTGHSSTSISAGLGLVEARDRLHEDYTVVSVIGDGALSGGMAYEALNNASRLKSNFIIILNDNHMSISESTGGFSKYLSKIRVGSGYNNLKRDVSRGLSKVPGVGEPLVENIVRAKMALKQFMVPGMFFENLDITYVGPMDGHNIPEMVRILEEAKKFERPILIHVKTKKGKGYIPAERYPVKFHGVGPFCIETGKSVEEKKGISYTEAFSHTICRLAEKDDKIVAVTAAMPEGTGLKKFAALYPDRLFDVGIAEEHAVTFAAGMAAGGLKPVVAVYSSFLQRAYDQMLHDVCLQKLPVVFAIDRAGLVGCDGETHQGIFDLSYLRSMPGMAVFAPMNKYELRNGLEFGIQAGVPFAVRYPRGTAYSGLKEYQDPIELGKSEVIYRGGEIALLSVGSMMETAVQVHGKLKESGISATLINVRFVKPMDKELLDDLAKTHGCLVTMEENVICGGYGEAVSSYIHERGYGAKVLKAAVPDTFVEHGPVDILKRDLGLDADSIFQRIKNEYIRKES